MKHTAMLFHMLGLAVWLGSFLAMAICLVLMKNPQISVEGKQALNRVQNRLTIIGNIGALLILISGFVMFSMLNKTTLWIDVMAALGGATSVFSIIVVSIQTSIMSGRIKSNKIDNPLNIQIGLLNISSWIVMVGIILVLVVVSYRL